MNCRSCGEAIRFVEMPSGSKMPVDPVRLTPGQVEQEYRDGRPNKLVLVYPSGHGRMNRLGEVEARTSSTPLHRSHFDTCRDAEPHRAANR